MCSAPDFFRLKLRHTLPSKVLQNFEPETLKDVVIWRTTASIPHANAFKETYLLNGELARLKGQEINVFGKVESLQRLVVGIALRKIDSATVEVSCSGPRLKGGNCWLIKFSHGHSSCTQLSHIFAMAMQLCTVLLV